MEASEVLCVCFISVNILQSFPILFITDKAPGTVWLQTYSLNFIFCYTFLNFVFSCDVALEEKDGVTSTLRCLGLRYFFY